MDYTRERFVFATFSVKDLAEAMGLLIGLTVHVSSTPLGPQLLF